MGATQDVSLQPAQRLAKFNELLGLDKRAQFSLGKGIVTLCREDGGFVLTVYTLGESHNSFYFNKEANLVRKTMLKPVTDTPPDYELIKVPGRMLFLSNKDREVWGPSKDKPTGTGDQYLRQLSLADKLPSLSPLKAAGAEERFTLPRIPAPPAD